VSAVVFSLATGKDIKRGDLIGAKRHSRLALRFNIASTATLVIGIIAVVIFFIIIVTVLSPSSSSDNRNSTTENGNLNALKRYSTIDKF